MPVSALPPGCQSNEVSEEVGDIKIENARGREEEFKLDRNGFQWFKVGPDGRGDFAKFNGLEYEAYADPEAIRSKYYPAVENFVCKALGARKVKAFNHEVRTPTLFWSRFFLLTENRYGGESNSSLSCLVARALHLSPSKGCMLVRFKV